MCTHVILPCQVDTQLKSGPLVRMRLCCPHRHHLSGPVRAPLRSSPGNLSISGFAAELFHPDDERPCGVQVLRFVSIIACRRPYSGFPIGARLPKKTLSHCFPIDNGLRPRRRGSACSLPVQVYPCAPNSPSNTCRGLPLTKLQRSFQITACEFGRRHRLGLTSGGHRPPPAIQDCRVGASSAAMLPPRRALYLFSQMGSC